MKRRTMPCAFILLLSLLVSRKTTGQDSSPSTLLLCDQITNGTLKVTCEEFHQALLENRLIAPPGQSAYDHFRELERADPLPGLVLALRIKLKGALQRELGRALELTSRLPATQTAMKLTLGHSFPDLQLYAQKVVELSGPEGEDQAAAQWQELYFAGLALHEKARRLQSRDTSDLMPAIERQMDALKTGGDIPQIHQELGDLFFAAKRYDQSRNFFLHANKLAPEWAAPVIGLSQYLDKFNEGESALAMADRAVSTQADFAESYLNAARLYAKYNKALKSMEYYRAALDRIVTDITSGPAEYRWYFALELSELLVQFELYDQAERFLKKVLAWQEAPEAYLLLGEIYESTNRTLSADSVYRRSISIWPDLTEAYLRGGAIYQGLGRYELAKPFFEEAYALNPQDREACFNLGTIRHLYNFPAEAEILYRHALAYPQGLNAVLDKMADLAKRMEQGDSKAATGVYALSNNPETFFKANLILTGPPVSPYEDYIYANLGDLYFAQGQKKEAIEMYQHALLLNPGLPEVYKSLIQACYDTEELRKAMLYIQLYLLYVPYTRETRDDWKTMNKLVRELSQKKIDRWPDEQINVYALFMDNFWTYFYSLNREGEGLNLERTLVLRQQRPILQLLKKNDLETLLK